MQWSRYNLMFKSKNNGWLLYNSCSNSFVQMDENTAQAAKQVSKNPNMDFSDRPDLFFRLRIGGFLVDDDGDDTFIRIIKMRRLISNYTGDKLSLAIAPTKECNFACTYCFEKNKSPSRMTDETADKLIKFIEKHSGANKLIVTWYGGEPLLEFTRIKDISKKMGALAKSYSAEVITNGYCLSPDIIAFLDKMNIKHIQITIDGSKETHDSRRYLVGGGKTYDKILENMDNLMHSAWKGRLSLRVNVDASNSGEFANVYGFIKNRYPKRPDSSLFIYPGFVTNEAGCQFNSDDKGRFLADLAQSHDIVAVPVFPATALEGCALTKRNAYVVGSDGELYKCWMDVGEKREVVGNIDGLTNWNTSLLAEGMVGASYLEDDKCIKCFYFPVCDGGCPKIRMRNNRDGKNRDTCTYFKKHASALLEIHYEQQTRCKNNNKEGDAAQCNGPDII